MDRAASLKAILTRGTQWDIAIIGGGATGVGIAVDASSRGYSTVLLEQNVFGKGTSSRSTKLVHGGVRYLQQGNISLVMEALKERGLLRKNAPHLVHDLAFIVPNYSWWEAPFYGIGMKVYDKLAGKYGFGKSRLLSKAEVLERIPTLEQDGLRGGVLYFDGQFDDSRLLIGLAQTAVEQRATLLNYAKVVELTRGPDQFIDGLIFEEIESVQRHTIKAKCVINATGAFCDAIRKIDQTDARDIVAPSQGIHLVLDQSFLPNDSAIMVPRTSDGRVMFAIPWHDHSLIGTTDTPIEEISLEPVAMEQEIDFILDTAGEYLHKRPTRGDVLSVFAGIRPLVKASETSSTAALSREHTIDVSPSGMITIVGGKWTTYRKMAEDCVDHAMTIGKLEERECVTRSLKIHGFQEDSEQFGDLRYYGSDALGVEKLIAERPELGHRLHESLPILGAQVVWAVRHEMARTVEDVLARRTRALFLNANAAMAMAAKTAELMASELGCDQQWIDSQVIAFNDLAKNYLVSSG